MIGLKKDLPALPQLKKIFKQHPECTVDIQDLRREGNKMVLVVLIGNIEGYLPKTVRLVADMTMIENKDKFIADQIVKLKNITDNGNPYSRSN